MTFVSWLSVAGICFMGAVSPGPSLAVVVRNTVQGSRRNGMITGVAHCMGVGFYALLTVTGLAALFALEPALHKALAWGGGTYLAFLGIQALRSKGASHATEDGAGPAGLFRAARDGLMISLLNPKLMIFFLALFSQFISPEMPRTSGAVMVLTATLIDGAWFCLVATLLSRGDFADRLARHSLSIDRVTGVLFLLLALRVFTL